MAAAGTDVQAGAVDSVSAAAGTGYQVRRVAAHEWEALRTLRLRALQDTPIAYLERCEEAIGQPEEEWRERARRGAAGEDEVTFIAETAAGEWVGMMGAFLEGQPADVPRTATVFAVFVAPEHRGRPGRVAERLLDAVTRWAAHVPGVERLTLFVHEHNPRAVAFYERMGFTVTGGTMPYPLEPGGTEIEMARPVALPGDTVRSDEVKRQWRTAARTRPTDG